MKIIKYDHLKYTGCWRTNSYLLCTFTWKGSYSSVEITSRAICEHFKGSK